MPGTLAGMRFAQGSAGDPNKVAALYKLGVPGLSKLMISNACNRKLLGWLGSLPRFVWNLHVFRQLWLPHLLFHNTVSEWINSYHVRVQHSRAVRLWPGRLCG